MEKKDFKEAFSTIRDIEKKMSDLEDVMEKLNISSRNEVLQEIYVDIVRNNEFLNSIEAGEIKGRVKIRERGAEDVFDFGQLTQLEGETGKNQRLILLKSFLDKLEGISESDINAILESLVNKDPDSIKQDVLQLTKVFKIKEL